MSFDMNSVQWKVFYRIRSRVLIKVFWGLRNKVGVSYNSRGSTMRFRYTGHVYNKLQEYKL